MPVDFTGDEPVQRLWRQQHMVDADAIVALPGTEIVPEGLMPAFIKIEQLCLSRHMELDCVLTQIIGTAVSKMCFIDWPGVTAATECRDTTEYVHL